MSESLHSSELGEVIGHHQAGNTLLPVRGVVCRRETRWVRNVFDPEGWPTHERQSVGTVPPPVTQRACKPTDLWRENVACPSHVIYQWSLDGDVLRKVAVVEHIEREHSKPEPKELDWATPSFTIEESQPVVPVRVHRLQKEIYNVCDSCQEWCPAKRTLVWKQPYSARVAKFLTEETKQRAEDRQQQCHFCCKTTAPISEKCPYCTGVPKRPSFPFAPKPSGPYKRPHFRNDKRRLGRSYLCPDCF